MENDNSQLGSVDSTQEPDYEAIGAAVFASGEDQIEPEAEAVAQPNADELEADSSLNENPADDELGEEIEPVVEVEPDPIEAQDSIPTADMDSPIKLADGTVTTVGELHQNSMFQSKFTQKTQDLASREAEMIQNNTVTMQQNMQAERDQMAAFMQATLPPKPDSALNDTDPFAYMQGMNSYNEAVGKYQDYVNRSQQAKDQAQQAVKEQQAVFDKQQHVELVKAVPEFRDPEKYKTWRDSANLAMGKHYGFQEQEVSNITNSRILQVMRDAMQWRTLQAAKPAAKKHISNVPVLASSPRINGKAKAADALKSKIRKANASGDASSLYEAAGESMANL